MGVIKEIVEFIDLEGGKLKDIILENRSLAKGLHIIVDKDNFEIKDFTYNNGSEEFRKFVNKYDLKRREYYCNYLDSNKNFDNSPASGKNQIHSASPYTIFFRYKNDKTILERLKEIKNRIHITGYFEKIKSLTKNSAILNHTDAIEKRVKNKLATKYFIKKIGKNSLRNLKNNDYIKIYFDFDINIVKNFYDEYSPQMSFNKKGLFEDKDKYTTSKKYLCPITADESELGTSEFLNTFTDKKPFYMHKTREKIYGGFSALYSGKIIQNLSLFEQLLKLKVKVDKYEKSLFPNPFPIFISNKDAIDNDGNRVYFELLKDIKEPISYKEIIKKVYGKIANNANEINDLNFYLIFWSNTKNGIEFYDVDYIDGFRYKLKDFKIKNIFELKDFQEGDIENIFELEWKFFSKFFYTINKNEQEKTYLLQNNYFAEKINVPRGEDIPSMVSTKFYQYNKLIYDVIYKSKLELINRNIFDDLTLPIIKERIRHNDDWQKTYKIKEKLSFYISLYKNFKGENLATKIIKLQEKMQKLLENSNEHLSSDEEFAYASGQLIWYILSKNESASKTHSLLDIFISKHKIDDFKLIIAQHIQKYSHAFKFSNNNGWFDKLASEVMGYELDKKSIKELVPLIMTGYFSENIIVKNLQKASEDKKQSQEGEKNGK